MGGVLDPEQDFRRRHADHSGACPSQAATPSPPCTALRNDAIALSLGGIRRRPIVKPLTMPPNTVPCEARLQRSPAVHTRTVNLSLSPSPPQTLGSQSGGQSGGKEEEDRSQRPGANGGRPFPHPPCPPPLPPLPLLPHSNQPPEDSIGSRHTIARSSVRSSALVNEHLGSPATSS